MKNLTTALMFLVLLSPASLAAGGKNMPSAQSVYLEIEKELPGAQFERESHIRLGSIAMTFVKPVIRLALDEDDKARAMISAIKRVDIATYRVVDLPEAITLVAIRRIESRMNQNGWNKIVRSREEDENTWEFSNLFGS